MWRSAPSNSGEQCATATGTQSMLVLCAGNWDTPNTVNNLSNQASPLMQTIHDAASWFDTGGGQVSLYISMKASNTSIRLLCLYLRP